MLALSLLFLFPLRLCLSHPLSLSRFFSFRRCLLWSVSFSLFSTRSLARCILARSSGSRGTLGGGAASLTHGPRSAPRGTAKFRKLGLARAGSSEPARPIPVGSLAAAQQSSCDARPRERTLGSEPASGTPPPPPTPLLVLSSSSSSFFFSLRLFLLPLPTLERRHSAFVRSFLPFLLRTPSLTPCPLLPLLLLLPVSRTRSSTGGSQAGDYARPLLAGTREEDRERGGDPPSTSGKTSGPKRGLNARRRPSRKAERRHSLLGPVLSAEEF